MARPPRSRDGAYTQARAHFADGVARICRLYGVSPLLGRLYAELFLSPEPLALEVLCARAGAAKSTASVALRKLLAARVVRRLPARGDRRDYYEAVADPWAIVADWSRHFLQPEIEMWRETGGELARALGSAGDAPRGEQGAALAARIARMQEFVGLFEQWLGTIARTRPRPAATAARPIAIKLDGDGEDEEGSR